MNYDRRRGSWKDELPPSYHGDDPYIFLSFAPFEFEEGLRTLRILEQAGCRIAYDRDMLTGRPWTTEICDAIEGCSVFFEVNIENSGFSLTKKLAEEFASLLKKKRITVYLYPSIPEKKDNWDDFFDSSLSDPSYPDRCRKALTSVGYFSDAQAGRLQTSRHDLLLSYYSSREARERAFGGQLPRHCNLRTHETWGYRSACSLDDEDLYCAVRWTPERFYLEERDPGQDYKPRQRDKEFTEKIRKLNGEAPEELEKRFVSPYDWIPKPHRPFPSGYPYMDEFEYLSSDDDD